MIALTTRTWATSLSIALMLTICYSNQLAIRLSWIYHVYGWIVPLLVSLIIYIYSTVDQSKEISTLGSEKFGKIQIILSICLLFLCILINSISLLRIARRSYRVKHDSTDNRSLGHTTQSNSRNHEVRPLIDGTEEQIDVDIEPIHAGSFFSNSFNKNFLLSI